MNGAEENTPVLLWAYLVLVLLLLLGQLSFKRWTKCFKRKQCIRKYIKVKKVTVSHCMNWRLIKQLFGTLTDNSMTLCLSQI